MNDKLKGIRHALFDLDGTLSDNSEGILSGVGHALTRLGAPVPERKTLLAFIGPPLVDAFMSICGFDEEGARLAVVYYREYFGKEGIFLNEMYDGVPAMLESLSAAGLKLYIATSKPEEYAKRIAAHFGIDKYFTYIGGATMDGKRGSKVDVIRYVLDTCGIDRSEAIMIGDRHHDISGAVACGIPSIGVTYGFGDREELTRAGADLTVDSVRELTNELM